MKRAEIQQDIKLKMAAMLNMELAELQDARTLKSLVSESILVAELIMDLENAYGVMMEAAYLPFDASVGDFVDGVLAKIERKVGNFA